jgi:hypothetical protein
MHTIRTGLLLAVFAVPAIGDECIAGLLASVQNKTCDIGILRFNFGQVEAGASSYDNDGMMLPTSLLLNSANFEFMPLPTKQVEFGVAATGYSITSLIGPQSLMAPPNGFSQAIVALDFSVTPQAGEIGGAGVVGTNISVSGQGYGISLMEADDLAPNGRVFARYNSGYYDMISGLIPMGATATGSSILFEFYNANGGADRWFGPTTTFLFFTPTATPETSSIVLLTTVMGLCCLLLRRRRLAMRDSRLSARRSGMSAN